MELKSFGIKSGGNSEVATNSGPKPGDFPLGSLESRAATRVMLGKRPQLVITVEAIGTGDVIERIFIDLASGQTRVEKPAQCFQTQLNKAEKTSWEEQETWAATHR